jgi:hypothetical protein
MSKFVSHFSAGPGFRFHNEFHRLVAALPGQESGAANRLAHRNNCWVWDALQTTFSDKNRMRQ